MQLAGARGDHFGHLFGFFLLLSGPRVSHYRDIMIVDRDHEELTACYWR